MPRAIRVVASDDPRRDSIHISHSGGGRKSRVRSEVTFTQLKQGSLCISPGTAILEAMSNWPAVDVYVDRVNGKPDVIRLQSIDRGFALRNRDRVYSWRPYVAIPMHAIEGLQWVTARQEADSWVENGTVFIKIPAAYLP
jgi:hypothetical protein